MTLTARRAAVGALTLTLAALAAGVIIGTGVQAWDRSGPLLGPLSFRGSGALILLYVPGSIVLGCCWGILLLASLSGVRPQRVDRVWLVVGLTVGLLALAVILPPVVFVLPWLGTLLVIRFGGMSWASAWLGAGFVLVTVGLLGGLYVATGGRPPGV